jgi:hypothetical protein
MPKAAGADMPKPVQLPSRPAPPSRSINHQPAVPYGPHHNPVQHPPIRGSNKIAANAVRVASNHDSAIDPRQHDPSNLN